MRTRICDRRWPRPRSQSAMTLVEVTVAVLILAIVAAGSVAFFIHARVMVEQAANRRTAVEVAEERLERARNAGYDALANAEGEVVVDGTTYSWTLSVSSAQANPSDSGSTYKTLDATVEWHGSLSGPILVRTGMSR